MKRDLGPDWREKLRDFAARCSRSARSGALLVGAERRAGRRARHPQQRRPVSFTTAAGGPPANWLGSVGAYASDALLLLFGPAAALFLPVIGARRACG